MKTSLQHGALTLARQCAETDTLRLKEVLHGLLEPLVSFRQELPVRPKARATRNADAGAVELECRRADAAVQVGGRHGGTIDRTPLELRGYTLDRTAWTSNLRVGTLGRGTLSGTVLRGCPFSFCTRSFLWPPPGSRAFAGSMKFRGLATVTADEYSGHGGSRTMSKD